MITKTKVLGSLLAAVMLSLPVMAYADNGGPDKDWHHGKEGHMMAKILGLTDDQVKQLKDIHQKQKEAMKTVFEQMKSNKQAFDAEIVKATPDMNKVNDIQTQIKAIQSQMVDNHLNSLLEIKKIMTPEQFAGYMALEKEEHMKKHMMGHGHDGDHHGGNKEDGAHDND